jgi:hypothetical protein
VIAIGVAAGLGQTVIFSVEEPHLLRKIANGAMPLGYVVIATALWLAHARAAFGSSAPRVVIPGMLLGGIAGYQKRNRLGAWLRGRAF